MLSRSRLVTLAARAKRLEAIDLALRYNPVARRRALGAVRAFAAADLAGRRSLAEAFTAQSLAAARQTPYGREFGRHLQDWPILRKERLRDHPADFARRGLLRVPAATGGTAGLPIHLVRSATSIAAEQVFLDRLIPAPGLTWRRARVASLRADFVKSTADRSPPYGYATHRDRRLVLSSPHLSAETLPWYLETLAAFRPDILWMYPTMAANLLRLLATTGTNLRVPLVMTSSERLDPVIHRAIGHEFGAAVIDYYGLAERTCLASSTGPGRYLFEPAYGRVELIPSDADEVLDGHRHVAIVATGYWNDAMPLIRYDTGDYAMVSAGAGRHELEAVALGLLPFHGVAGRSSDFIYGSGGTRICGLNHLPREVRNLLQVQIVQERLGSALVRALVRPGFGPADLARLEVNARAKLPPGIDLRIDIVGRLETTAQGKTPYVIRRVPAPAAQGAAPGPVWREAAE